MVTTSVGTEPAEFGQVCRIRIAGEWLAADMAEFFSTIEDLYNFDFAMDKVAVGPPMGFPGDFVLRVFRPTVPHYYLIEPRERLHVVGIAFASPGEAQFFGKSRAALKYVHDTVKLVIRWKEAAEKHRAEMAMAVEKVEAQRIKNVDAKLAILKKLGVPRHELAKIAADLLTRENQLERAIVEGRIVDAELVTITGGHKDR